MKINIFCKFLRMNYSFFLLLLLFFAGCKQSNVEDQSKLIPVNKEKKVTMMKQEKDHLVVLWSSADREVALKMVFMYTFNAKKKAWWDKVTLIVWGPSTQLLSQDEELQNYISNMIDQGIHLEACKACSDMYGVSDTIDSLGIKVVYMGEPLTKYLKDDNTEVITF